jgi:putative hydrolase of the HAD superfamily
MWSGCLAATLVELGHPGLTREDVRPLLAGHYPWDSPQTGHADWGDADGWWSHFGVHLVGVAAILAPEIDPASIVPAFRRMYCDPAGFRLFDDTLPALIRARTAGCRNVIVSNHVPELAEIVAALGLEPWIDQVICSAEVGWEKPDVRIFQAALGDTDPATVAMLGDNETADVQGPAQLGVRGLLVHHPQGNLPPLTLQDALDDLGLPAG